MDAISSSLEAVTESSPSVAITPAGTDNVRRESFRDDVPPSIPAVAIVLSSTMNPPDETVEPPSPQEGRSSEQPSGREEDDQEAEDRKDNETDATAESAADGNLAKPGVGVKGRASSMPIVSTSKKNRPPYKYDPSKITLRFLFANRDGLSVTINCDPSDTVGEIKTSLLSVWPRGKKRDSNCRMKSHGLDALSPGVCFQIRSA
jgi:hypothetical protein